MAGVFRRFLGEVFGGVNPPRPPDAASVSAVALQVLLHAAILALEMYHSQYDQWYKAKMDDNSGVKQFFIELTL